MKLEEMTIEQLRAKRRQDYEGAQNSGILTKLANVARFLGEHLSHSYGPKYRWEKNNICIYVDDYGNYMTVHLGEKLICSTHNERLFAPGDWLTEIHPYIDESIKMKEQKEKERKESERQILIKEMSIN